MMASFVVVASAFLSPLSSFPLEGYHPARISNGPKERGTGALSMAAEKTSSAPDNDDDDGDTDKEGEPSPSSFAQSPPP